MIILTLLTILTIRASNKLNFLNAVFVKEKLFSVSLSKKHQAVKVLSMEIKSLGPSHREGKISRRDLLIFI